MKKAIANTDASSIRVLKIATCPSLSGKSTLTYHVGCNGKSDIHFRIYANSGGGFHSNEWIAAKDIQRALGKQPIVTFASLMSVFEGKSVNTAGFLLAVLKHEGLVGPSEEKPRCYVRTESEAFVAEVKALMQSAVDLDPDEKPKAAGAKGAKAVKAAAPAVVKEPAAPAKKSASTKKPVSKPGKE